MFVEDPVELQAYWQAHFACFLRTKTSPTLFQTATSAYDKLIAHIRGMNPRTLSQLVSKVDHYIQQLALVMNSESQVILMKGALKKMGRAPTNVLFSLVF